MLGALSGSNVGKTKALYRDLKTLVSGGVLMDLTRVW